MNASTLAHANQNHLIESTPQLHRSFSKKQALFRPLDENVTQYSENVHTPQASINSTRDPKRLSVSSAKCRRASPRFVSESISDEIRIFDEAASPAFAPSAWSPCLHLPSRMSVPSPMRPRSIQIAAEYEEWEGVEDPAFIHRNTLLQFYRDTERELLVSNSKYPDTDASLYALAGESHTLCGKV